MQPVDRHSIQLPTGRCDPAPDDLTSLCAKLEAWGPMETARLLLDRSATAQAKVAGLEIQVRQVQVRRLRQEQKRFMDEQIRQAKKADDWKLAGSILACFDQVLIGVCRIGQDYHQAKASLATHHSKVAGLRLRLTGEVLDQLVNGLQDLCDAEQKMVQRLEQQSQQQLSSRDEVLEGIRRA